MRLFGIGRDRGADAAALESIKRQSRDLLIEPSPADCKRAFESWSWAYVPKADPILVSAFGDAFFDVRGGVVMLDTLEGALKRVAASVVDLQRALESVDQQDKLLCSVWVQAARRQALNLAPGECYDWKVAPRIGGQLTTENLNKLDFVVKVNIAGQLHDQVRKLPPGTRINRVTIS